VPLRQPRMCGAGDPPAALASRYRVNMDLGVEGVKGFSAVRTVGEALAYSLVSIANMLNIRRVVLGGYPAAVLDYVYGETLRRALAKYDTPASVPLTVATSRLGDLVGIQGRPWGRRTRSARWSTSGPPSLNGEWQ
jgi:hypothetical protein